MPAPRRYRNIPNHTVERLREGTGRMAESDYQLRDWLDGEVERRLAAGHVQVVRDRSESDTITKVVELSEDGLYAIVVPNMRPSTGAKRHDEVIVTIMVEDKVKQKIGGRWEPVDAKLAGLAQVKIAKPANGANGHRPAPREVYCMPKGMNAEVSSAGICSGCGHHKTAPRFEDDHSELVGRVNPGLAEANRRANDEARGQLAGEGTEFFAPAAPPDPPDGDWPARVEHMHPANPENAPPAPSPAPPPPPPGAVPRAPASGVHPDKPPVGGVYLLEYDEPNPGAATPERYYRQVEAAALQEAILDLAMDGVDPAEITVWKRTEARIRVRAEIVID